MLTQEILKNKRIIVRGDLDVPVKAGRVEDSFRLEALLPTLKLCLSTGRQTLLIGHLGRPEGEDQSLSLVAVKEWLKTALNLDIPMFPSGYSPGEWWGGESPLILLDNLRFNSGEEKLSKQFANDICRGGDIYVYEAFASYRPSTSLQIIPETMPTYTGIQFDKEVSELSRILKQPTHPTLLLASGAKPDKLAIIRQISSKFDQVIYGGKFAPVSDLTPDGLDLSEEATAKILTAISHAKTIVLNGPLGKYEDGVHATSTKTILQALKDSSAFSLVGGGDTTAAIPSLGFAYTDYGFVSTGGGAMLEFLATGTHPLLNILAALKKL